MKSFALFLIFISLSQFTIAADNKEYLGYMDKISKTQSVLSKCLPDEDNSAACYIVAEKQFKKIITDVRSKYASKVNPNLWQSINLGYIKRNNNCRSDYLDGGSTHIYAPYIDCKSVNLHDLAVVTVELHVR